MPARTAHIGSARRIHHAERARQALELRKAGVDYRTIAERLGYAHASGAYDAVKRALKALTKVPAEELRELECARLDAMLMGVWNAAKAGDDKAIQSVLRIMRRRADLLGLDAPLKREETVTFLVETFAEKAAREAGLDPAVVVAEAERIIAFGMG
jgi:hypothetical protein